MNSNGVSIRLRLILIMVILAILSVCSIGIYSYYTIHNFILKNAEIELSDVMSLNSERVNQYLQKTSTDIENLSQDPNITSLEFSDTMKSMVQASLNSQINEMDQFDYLMIVKPNGQVFTTNYLKGYTNKEIEQLNTVNYNYHKTTIENGKGFMGIGTSPVNKEKAFIVARPVKQLDGQIKGYVAGIISLPSMIENVNNIKTTDKYNFLIVSDIGQVIYSSNQEEILADNFYTTDTEKIKNIEFNDETGIAVTSFNKDKVEYLASVSNIGPEGWKLIISNSKDDFLTTASMLKNRMIIFGFIIILIAAGVVYFFSNRIGSSIKEINDKTNQISRGNLTTKVNVDRKDELGNLSDSVNNMVEDLRSIVRDISTKSDEVNVSADKVSEELFDARDSAEQVSKAIEQVAAGAEKQASNFTQIVETVEKMVEGIKTMKSNSQGTAQNAKQSLQSVEEGNKWMQQLISQMDSINNKVETMSKIMESLDNTSREIGEIVEIINNIAKQTNLLALNAAIEAARAGEYGRGFSVVADEIRDLAEDSISSVEKIAELIDSIQNKTKEAVDSMLDEREAVKEGKNLVDQTGQVFEDIQELTDVTHNDAIKADQMSEKIVTDAEDVFEKVESSASIAREISASSEEVTASAEEQASLMNEMKDAVDKLKTLSKDMDKMIDKFTVN